MVLLNPIEKSIQLLEDQEVEKAMTLLEEQQQSASADELFTIATVYMQWGFLQEAEKVLQQLHEQFPAESEVSIMLADVYIELEQDEKALHLLEDIQHTDEAYGQVLLQLADIYQAQGLFEVAEMKLLEAKQFVSKEDMPVINFALGEFYFSIGSYKQSIPFYESILTTEQVIAHVSIYERLAEAHASIGEYEKAFHMYEHVESTDVDSLFKQGFTAYKSNRLEVAISIWERITELDPYYAVVYYYIAKTYLELRMLEEAKRYAEQGLHYDEYNKELHYLTSQIAHELHDIDLRNRHIQAAIDLDREYTEAVLFYMSLLKDEEDYEEIVHFTTEMEKQGIVEPLYIIERARAYEELEMFEQARTDFDQMYIHFKQDPEFLKEYSFFLIEEGAYDLAKEMLESLVSIDPLDEESIEMLHRLKENEM